MVLDQKKNSFLKKKYIFFFLKKKKQIEVGDLAVYCLFQKRRKPKRQGVEENQRLAVAEASVLDLTVEDGWEFPQPCSSCSSGVTEVSSNGTESTDQEESSSGLGLGLGFSSYFLKLT